jgi:hypothetical protein
MPFDRGGETIAPMHPGLTTLVVATLAAGYLMIAAGMGKRLLEWRRPVRRCPSCGRLRRDCSCVG